MSELPLGTAPSTPDARRIAALEKRIAALELLVTTSAETNDFKLRNLKRDITTVSRSLLQRGAGSGGG